MRKVNDNVGLLPIKLGNAKVKQYTFTFIHFNDLHPIIQETNKLYINTISIVELVNKHREYKKDSVHYVKALQFLQKRVENKISEIIPHSNRTKRGLVNVVGSVFKAVTGNLDASDGERYEKLIQNLQKNQNSLEENIRKQNYLSIGVIDKFNLTIQQITQNEKILQGKIDQIALIINSTTYSQNSHFIKDTLNQLIIMYETIDSILQDIENSLTFSKLKIMHPSIIKTDDLFIELKNIQAQVGENLMPLPVKIDNILYYENIIELECFILNNKITYLLHFPITFQMSFTYFHLFSIPIYYKSLFKAILPVNKYLIKGQLHYAFENELCKEAMDSYYICDTPLKEVSYNSPCSVQLLQSKTNNKNCKQVELKITQPIVNQLDNTNQWLVVLPYEVQAHLKCFKQEERAKFQGTYIFEIPPGCETLVNDLLVINERKIINTTNQLILFDDYVTEDDKILPTLHLTSQISEIRLDNLHTLKNQLIENQPHLVFDEVSKYPSLWTLLLYLVIFILCIYLMYKKFPRCRRDVQPPPSRNIQLPPQSV